MLAPPVPRTVVLPTPARRAVAARVAAALRSALERTDGSGIGAALGSPDDQAFAAFDRAQFLLAKQLVDFDRYGQQYLPDVPLLDDPDAFRALLGQPAGSARP